MSPHGTEHAVRLNYEVLRLPNGNASGLTETSVSLWTPCAKGQTC